MLPWHAGDSDAVKAPSLSALGSVAVPLGPWGWREVVEPSELTEGLTSPSPWHGAGLGLPWPQGRDFGEIVPMEGWPFSSP